MDLLGIAWEILLEPMMYWLSTRWVRFVVRKQRIWEPGVPFPRYFGQIHQTMRRAPFEPWGLLRALLPMQKPGHGWDKMVFEQYRR